MLYSSAVSSNLFKGGKVEFSTLNQKGQAWISDLGWPFQGDGGGGGVGEDKCPSSRTPPPPP